MEKVIIETLVKKVKKINWYPKIYEDSIVGFVDLIRTSVEASHNGMKIEIIKKDYKNCYDNTNTGKPEYVLIIDIEKGNILEISNLIYANVDLKNLYFIAEKEISNEIREP